MQKKQKIYEKIGLLFGLLFATITFAQNDMLTDTAEPHEMLKESLKTECLWENRRRN